MAEFILLAVLGVVYCVVGFVVGSPYMWLSDGFGYAMEITFFTPIVAFGLFLLCMFARGIRNPWVFVVPLFVVCVPILMNGAHHVLGWLGYADASVFVHEYRFAAAYVVVFVPLALLCVCGMAVAIWRKVGDRFVFKPPAPPSSPPPSSSEEPRKIMLPRGNDDILQCVWN